MGLPGLTRVAADGRYAAVDAAYAGDNAAARSTATRPKVTWLFNMATGHGWTGGAGGGGSLNLNYAADGALSNQCAQVITSGDGGSGGLLGSPSNLTVDLTGKYLVVAVKIPDISKFAYLDVYAGDSTLTNYYKWTTQKVATGSAVQPPFINSGEWTLLTLSFAEAAVTGTPTRSAIQKFRTFVADNGSAVPVTMFLGGVGTMPEPTTTYPKGFIVLSLDDSAGSQWSTAYPLLTASNLRATMFPIIGQVGTQGSLTLGQLSAMHDAGGFEIGCHATTSASHAKSLTGMSHAERVTELRACRDWNLANGWAADSWAYPNGYYDAASTADVRALFTTGRTIYSKAETVPFPQRGAIRCFNTGNQSASALTGIVDKIVANKSAGVFVTHSIVNTPGITTDTATASYTAFVQYIAAQGVPVLTMREAARALAA